MPLLFSYGTLQRNDVQLAAFGRLLEGQRDELPGYVHSLVPIGDLEFAAAMGMTHYANITPNGNNGKRVSGTVFEITEAELSAADEYERDADYRRIPVTLASGKQAWVYLNVPAQLRDFGQTTP